MDVKIDGDVQMRSNENPSIEPIFRTLCLVPFLNWVATGNQNVRLGNDVDLPLVSSKADRPEVLSLRSHQLRQSIPGRLTSSRYKFCPSNAMLQSLYLSLA